MLRDVIQINGVCYGDDELRKLIASKSEYGAHWEVEVFQFIEEWMYGSGEIKMFTSGSTGQPKEMTFERTALESSARATLQYFNLEPGQSVLLCLPIKYVAARLMVVRAIIGQLNLVMVEPDGNPLLMLGETINFAAMVPLQVMNALEACPYKFELVQQLIIGGSSVPKNLIDKLQLVDTLAFETYGMTETLTHVAVRPINGVHQSDFFTALPQIKFEQADNMCLRIIAPYISRQVIQTNDEVELLNDYTFVFKGRIDFVINSGGIKIHPETLERKLAGIIQMPFAIVGVPDAKLGQKVVLVLEGTQNRDLLAQLRELTILDKYEMPKEVFFMPLLPKLDNGKLHRNKIIELLRRQLSF